MDKFVRFVFVFVIFLVLYLIVAFILALTGSYIWDLTGWFIMIDLLVSLLSLSVSTDTESEQKEQVKREFKGFLKDEDGNYIKTSATFTFEEDCEDEESQEKKYKPMDAYTAMVIFSIIALAIFVIALMP